MYKNIDVSLESVKKLIEKKTGKEVQIVSSKDKGNNIPNERDFVVFLNNNIEVSSLKLEIKPDGDCIFSILDKNGIQIEWSNIHTILWDFELEEGNFLSLEGARNGILVIDNKCLNEEDVEFLYKLSK